MLRFNGAPKNHKCGRLIKARVRANYQCEYCRSSLTNSLYELDHIVPSYLSGDDSLYNLAVTCTRCNRNKGVQVRYIDPHSRSYVRIFNPRADSWSEHFRSTPFGEIVGKTQIGRATAALLFRSTSRLIPPDLSWDKIECLERSEPLYRFLNELRFRRLRNDFRVLTTGLKMPLNVFECSPTDLEVAETAKHLLFLEMLMTRANPDDIDKGIKSGTLLYKRTSGRTQKELSIILSVLYQQRATLRYSSEDTVRALVDQRRAADIQQPHAPTPDDALSDQERLRAYLRDQSLALKYARPEFSKDYLPNLLHTSIDLSDDRDFRHLVYLADLALSEDSKPHQTRETIFQILTQVLETGGYGQTMDRAQFVTLRRRWWVLHLLLEKDPWIDALIADIIFWREIEMHNEVRELQMPISRTTSLLPPRIAELIEQVFATNH